MVRKRPHILVVGARSRDRKVLSSVSDYALHFLDLPYNTRANEYPFDIIDYLNAAREYIKAHGVNGIFYSFDIGSLIAAVLCKEFNLPGPSLETAFQCFHKYYTRLAIPNGLKPRIYRLGDSLPTRGSYPFYLKAPTSAAGILGFTIESEKKMKTILPLVERELPKMNEPLSPFFQSFLDLTNFPLALQHVMIIEEPRHDNQVTIEGFVYNRSVNFTIITDTNFERGSRLIDNFSMPTRISQKIKTMIEARAREDVIRIGITNSFFNAEYWCTDSSVELIEINCRSANTFYNLYNQVFGYDVYRAGLELCLGKYPAITINPPTLVGGQFNVNTTKEGNANSMFNYDVVIPEFTTTFIHKNQQVRQLSEFGQVMTQIEIVGESFKEIEQKAGMYREQLMKKSADIDKVL